jgi:hypothetical protein
MAYDVQGVGRGSVSTNEPIYTLADSSVVGCFREYNYHTADTQAVVSASGYFNNGTAYQGMSEEITTGDYMQVYSSTDDSLFKYRLTNTAGVITSELQGGLVQSTTAITAALFNGMYAAPIELLAAPGANRILMLESVVLAPSNVLTTDYASGGAVHVQYVATASGGGLITSGTVAATEFTSDAETTTSILRPVTVSGNSAVAATLIQNAPLCLSNATGAFTTGTVTYNAYARARVLVTAAAA